MQNKGLIKFSQFYLHWWYLPTFFHFVANKVKMMQKHLLQVILKEARYLDSIGKENVFNLGFTNFNFDEVSDKQINKVLT
jgi:SecD/SecF fusion protein